MSKPQQWTIEEAVVLLHGHLQIINCGIPRSEIIRQVSSDLRRMATFKGQKIDDVFRNENGITFQLASMESAYYGRTIMKPATNLFVQVVDLYRNNRVVFDRVLKGALDMLENKVTDHEENFMNWLSKQVNPMQLSELYGTYKDIEEFCLKVKTINSPLFSSVSFDRAKKVKSTVETNKVFRFYHKKNIKKFIAAATYYSQYCKMNDISSGKLEDESQIKRKSATDHIEDVDERLAQKYPIIYKKVKNVVCSTNDKLSVTEIKSQIGPIARIPDIEYILANASWGYQIEEKNEPANNILGQYFSVLNTRLTCSLENTGEAIKNWDDVIQISNKLVAKNRHRDNLFFVLLINTGLTVDVVLNLKISHFLNQKKTYKTVLTVYNEEDNPFESREYSINNEILSALVRYLLSKQSYSLDEYLFVGENSNSDRFKPLSRQTAQNIFTEIAQEIDNKYHISSLSLRKTFEYHFVSTDTKDGKDDGETNKSEPLKLLSDIIKIKMVAESKKQYRDNLLFAIGLGFGLTARDLRLLRFNHILNDDGSIKKNFPIFTSDFYNLDSEFYVEISDEIKNAIELYRNHIGIPDLKSYIFKSESSNKTENALSRAAILQILSNLALKAGVDIRFTTLTFKKTFVYHQLLMSGGSAQMKAIIRKALSHSNISQTMDFLCSNEKEFEGSVQATPINYCTTQDSAQVQTVDFNLLKDYSYTIPQSFTYFSEEYKNLRSWTDLYVKVFTCLYEDYSHILKPGMSFSRSAGGRTELTTEDQQSVMIAPKKIANTNLVLETNISASNMISKVRFWLEICNVDFENVEIHYVKKTTVGSSRRTEEIRKVVVAPVHTVVADEKYKVVLQDRFKKGFRLGSGLDLKKFKRYYYELHSEELHEDDNTIGVKIRNCGIVHEEKLFIPEAMLSDELKDKLFSYISNECSQGKKGSA